MLWLLAVLVFPVGGIATLWLVGERGHLVLASPLPGIRSDRLKRWWPDHHHGKVPDLACAIVTRDHDIPRTDLDQILPCPIAREIVLDGPPTVTLLDHPRRHAHETPCQPAQVCMLVGGGDFVLEHRPEQARRVSQDEATALLLAEHERGHVHTARFTDAAGHTFDAVAVPYLAEVEWSRCMGCGTCVGRCATAGAGA